MWTCPKCHSKVDPSFEVCWNCGTSPDGTWDPSFVKADDAGPIDDGPLVPRLDVREGVAVAGELPEPPRGDLVEAYRAYDLLEAKFLKEELNRAGLQAVADTHDFRETIGTMEGGPRIWVHQDDLPRARAWLEAYDREKIAKAGD